MKLQQQEMIDATPDEFGRLLHDFSERLLKERKAHQHQKLNVPPFVVLHPCDEYTPVIWARVNAPIQEALDSPPSEYTVLGNPRKATDLYFGSIHAQASGGGQRQTVVTLYYWDQGKRWIEGLWKLLLTELRRQGLLCEMKIADDDTARSPGRPKLSELDDGEIEKRKTDLRSYWVFRIEKHMGKKEAEEQVGHSPKTMKAWDDMWPEVGEEVKKLEMERIRKSKR